MVRRIIRVAAQYFGCYPHQVKELKEDNYGMEMFEYAGKTISIGIDKQANAAFNKYLKDFVWIFDARYLASFTKEGMTPEMIDRMEKLRVKPNGNTEILKLVGIKKLSQSERNAENNRGYCLSDGVEEIKLTFDDIEFFIYRMN